MRLASKYSLPFATGTKSRLFSRQGAGLYASSTLYASSLSQTRTIVIGRASPPHTKAYVKTSNSSLFHKIEVPGLYINPFIVQPSHRYQGKSTRDQFIQFEHSVRTHKANCFCIYRHDGVQSYNDWYFHHMDPLLGRNKLRREDVILMAKVGVSVFPHQNIQTQLEQIKARCGISHVDIIILEVDSLTTTINRANLESCLSTLEAMCQAQELHCYGMEINAAPYCYHKPSSRAASSSATLPIEMECRAGGNLPHLDVFMYSISPTIRIPATYPFLDPDPEEAQFIPGGGGTSRERSRSLTRIASNPLTGYCGGGNESRLDGRGTKMLAAWWAEYKRRQVPDVDESLLESIIDSDSRRSAGDNETDSVTKRKKKQKKKSNQNKSDNTSTSNSDSVNKTIADSTTIAETVGALLEESVGRLQNGEPLMTVAPMLLAGKQQLAKLRDQTDHRLKSLDMVMTDGSLENDSSNSSDISSSNGDTSIKYGAFKDSIANPENSTDVAMDPLSLARKHRADQQHAAQILTQLEDAVAEMERELMEAYPETATEYSDFMQKHANDEISVQPLDEDDNGDDDEEEDSASNDDEPDLGSDFRRRELDADLRQSMAQIQSISARPNAVLFVSGTNEPELEQRIRTQLDEMSPPLTLSDSLQAKALRLALSIGVDLVAVDSDVLLTVTEPCTLLPEDLIVASDSEAVFSYFTLPPPKKSTE